MSTRPAAAPAHNAAEPAALAQIRTGAQALLAEGRLDEAFAY
ncbi:MAG: hypothetical protein ACREL7_00535 [Longimicrobiales bacterium]